MQSGIRVVLDAGLGGLRSKIDFPFRDESPGLLNIDTEGNGFVSHPGLRSEPDERVRWGIMR